jgi:hypothetical protein
MRQAGRVTAEDMNQLTNANIPGWELLSKAIGKTVAETKKLGEQGKLNGGAAVDAITAMMKVDPRFAGQADAFAEGLEGLFAQAEDVREVAAARATEGLTQNIKRVLKAGLGGNNQEVIRGMADSINTAITPVAEIISATAETALGGGITSGLNKGIQLGKDLVKAQLGDLISDGVIGTANSILEINSPSKVFIGIGHSIGEGLEIGIRQSVRAIRFSNEIEKIIEENARRTGLPPELIRAMMRQESGGRAGAVSPKGARGLM